MITFKEKQYTIEEGHYTGPKDLEEVPGWLETVGKSSIAGGALGAVLGSSKELYEMSKGPSGRPEGSLLGQAFEGYKTGGKYGIAAGILAKILLNSLHNPMKDVKFAEVDRNIRTRFGMFRAGGFTVGDSMDRRSKYDEKFATNDRDITAYKINVVIQDGKVTLYLLSLTDEELKKINNSLDYYCKKFYGMDYQSRVIGASSRENSYSVCIRFTSYQTIGDFLSEISDVLMLKINLLDSKAIVENKIRTNDFASFQPAESDELKTFSSVPRLNKIEVIELLSKTGLNFANLLSSRAPIGESLSWSLLSGITDTLQKLSGSEEALVSKGKVKKIDLGNKYLETCLKECNFIEEIHYTVDHKNVPVNMYLHRGDLIICIAKNDVCYKKFLKIYDGTKGFFGKNDVGQVVVCTYPVKSKDELKVLLKKIISSGIVPNIFLV